MKLIAIPLLIPVVWNVYTTFLGLSELFDLPTNPSINPGQFMFGVIITTLILIFVLAIQIIWNYGSGDLLVVLLQAASFLCMAFDVVASWRGTKQIISFYDDDPGKAVGLAFVIMLSVLAKVCLSIVLFRKPNA